MLLIQYAYPFDPNGTATTNKVLGERHTITPVNGTDFRFIIPRAAPFFKASMQLRHVASNTPLLEGIHWAAGHKFDRASNTEPFLAVYGSLLLLDNAFDGVIELVEYQSLGGEFTINETLALELLANAQLDPRMAKWDNVLNTPTTYDPLLHRHHASESTGYEEFAESMRRVAAAVEALIPEAGGGSTVDTVARSHIANMNNPHNTMLAQLPDAQHLTLVNEQHVDFLIQLANGEIDLGVGDGSISAPATPNRTQLITGDFIIPDNSTGAATYLMPTNPDNLATIAWMEGAVSFATNKFVLEMTDKPIMGLSEDFEITSAGSGGRMVYFSALGYWKVYLDTQAGSNANNSGGGGTGPVNPNNPVNKAQLTSPTAEQVGLSSLIDLTSNMFNTTPALSDSLLHYEWETASDAGFLNLYWRGTTATNQARVAPLLPSGSRVHARVRFVGQNSGAGPWSDVVAFTIDVLPGPTTVTVTGTQLASGGVSHQFTINASAYTGPETHSASQFQVLNLAGTVVYDSGELDGAIIVHRPFDFNFRPENLTDYTARVRFKLDGGVFTEFTSSGLRTGNGRLTSFNTTFNTNVITSTPFNYNTSYHTVGGSIDPYGAGPGPYRVCYSGDANTGEADWVCDPENRTSNAPPEYDGGSIQLLVYTYPLTSRQTVGFNNYTYSQSTSRNTQHWTEW